jgi:two-component system KDP operon response regulator KdpE
MNQPEVTMLVIDDEPQIRRVLRQALSDEHVRVLEAESGRAGIDLAAAEQPAFIVLDLGLPDIAGIDVCKEIRRWSDVPILVLSARLSDEEKVRLLDAGADDFVTKPFSTPELKARIRALRRRHVAEADGEPLRLGTLVLDLVAPRASRDEVTIHLTRTEWDLLRTLVRHTGRTLTHRQLFTAVWGSAHGDAQQHLRVHVRSLRRKLEENPVQPKLIVTEPGVGYRFESVL